MAVVGGAPSMAVVLLACLVVQIGFGGYGIGECCRATRCAEHCVAPF